MGSKQPFTRHAAIRFIVLFGVISLFADVTYEGARSITGPFLAVLGASGTVVGLVAGFGELAGYGLRLVSGYLSDRTGRYWLFVIAGYAVNLLAVPALALAGSWEVAAALMVTERVGKAIRVPARDAMLSHATGAVGHGWGFGLHEALDQIGAVAGPLLVAAAIAGQEGFRGGFALLLIPALLALAVLLLARRAYPEPQLLEAGRGVGGGKVLEGEGLPGAFWLYLAAAACVAAGYADFPLIAYHFERTGVVPGALIPLFYAAAMGVDALAALLFGRLFDRVGLVVLAGAVLLSAAFAPLVFFGGIWAALAGMVLWGVGMGAQESVLRAAVASMIPPGRRGSAFGFFNAGFGLFWFLGSAFLGVLYDLSLAALVVFSTGAQLLALPLLLAVWRRVKDA